MPFLVNSTVWFKCTYILLQNLSLIKQNDYESMAGMESLIALRGQQ